MKMNNFEYIMMTFDQGRNFYLQGIVRELRDISQLGTGKKILEIGCGNGTGTQLIQKYFNPSEYIATEFDQRLVEIAKIKTRNSGVIVEEGNATDLRFQDNEFDAVIGLSVIHHIQNWRDCIDELHRITRHHGSLILKELSIETFETPVGRFSRRLVAHPYDSMLRKNEFLKHIERTGFKVIDCRPHSMFHLLSDFFLVARKER